MKNGNIDFTLLDLIHHKIKGSNDIITSSSKSFSIIEMKNGNRDEIHYQQYSIIYQDMEYIITKSDDELKIKLL